jgi:hypothetical protein
MGNGPYPVSPPPQKHHWTATPMFWVTVGILILTAIIVALTIIIGWPQIHSWFSGNPN